MTRVERCAKLAELITEYYGNHPGLYTHYGTFKLRGSKEELLSVIKWLYKYHRKEYYYLANRDDSHKFKDVIFAYEGDNGYLPHFSDEPDYYYIYG